LVLVFLTLEKKQQIKILPLLVHPSFSIFAEE
jgi:hypothetical protein